MSDFEDMSLHLLSDQLCSQELSGCPLIAVGVFAILLDKTHSTMGTTNHLRQQEKAFAISHRWLSLRRTPAQVNSILSQTCHCSSPYLTPSGQIHTIGVAAHASSNFGVEPTPGEYFVTLCTMGLTREDHVSRKVPYFRLYHLSLRTAWPYSSSDVLPHGPSQTVGGLMDWLVGDSIVVTGKVAEILTVVIEYTWPLSVPAIMKSDRFPAVYNNAANHWVDYMLAVGKTNKLPAYTFYAEQISGAFIHLTLIIRLMTLECSHPTAVASFLGSRHEAEKIIVGSDRMIAILGSINRAFALLSNSESRKWNEMSGQLEHVLVSGIGVVIYNVFPSLRSQFESATVAIHPMILKNLQPADVDIPGISFWSTLTDWLWYHWIRQDCSAPGCNRTTEELGRNLRYCAGCRWVPYCSRACQKVCWRREERGGRYHGHRTVCALLRYIGTRHDIPQNTKKLRDVMKRVPRLMMEDVLVIEAINKEFALDSES
jgi:hypothetical protein